MPPMQPGPPLPTGTPALGKIAFIGGGVMAEAVVRSLLARGLTRAADVTVGEPVAERRQQLGAQYGVRTVEANWQAVKDAGIVVLAVKPQQVGEVLADLRNRLTPDQLLLSIAAGVTVKTLVEGLGHEAVVRVMPNTPAQVGAGISVWTATPSVAPAGREQARLLLGALGREVFVAEEKYLDMATALSGSGPGYVFLFIEALIDAGVHIGFPRAVAAELAIQTVLGSAAMARETGMHPAELRNMVTSPGGTTAAGLVELEEGRLRAVVDRAVVAAYERSRELGRS